MILLQVNGWNKDRAFERWFNDVEKTKLDAGLMEGTSTDASTSDEVVCGVCADTLKKSETLALSCNHTFCLDCWEGWIKSAMDKGPQVMNTTCPAFKCKRRVPQTIISRFLDEKGRKALHKYNADTFVDASSQLKYCPGKRCHYIARYAGGGVKGIKCKCGHSWCFACESANHEPVSCVVQKEWARTTNSEEGNEKWLLANTKACPKCKSPIEKNQGCQHMTCRKASCGYEFCWMCMLNWRGHKACNRYDGHNAPTSSDAVKARAELKRYEHFVSRFDAHSKAVNFAERTLMETSSKMINLQEITGTNTLQTDFLYQAVDEVIECRRVLAWTYVYAYFLDVSDGASSRKLFETGQEQLEEFTDKLHEHAEQKIDKLMEPEIRTHVIHLTNVIRKFRKNVIATIESSTLPLKTDKSKSAGSSSSATAKPDKKAKVAKRRKK